MYLLSRSLAINGLTFPLFLRLAKSGIYSCTQPALSKHMSVFLSPKPMI